jgi:pimeloyl-ACP methyl ester carboxylesterase
VKRNTFKPKDPAVRAASLALLATLAFSPLALTAQQASANILFARTTAHPSPDTWDIAQGRTALDTEIDDVTLRGYLYEGKNPNAPTILFFNSESVLISQGDAFYRSLAALGPTVIVYDYRGLGYSTGKPDVALFRQDGLELYDRVVRSIRADHPVIVYGFSMGTAIAAYVASQRPVAALVLAAPMASAADELPIYARLLGKGYENVTPCAEATSLLDEPSLVAQSQAPLLVIHSSTDFLVPVSQGNKVFAASTAPSKQFVLLSSTTHGATPGSPAALKAVKQLLTTTSPK